MVSTAFLKKGDVRSLRLQDEGLAKSRRPRAVIVDRQSIDEYLPTAASSYDNLANNELFV